MPGGRPTDYREEYIAKVDKYLACNKDEIKKSKIVVKLPTIDGFAKFIDVPRTTIYEWKRKFKEFSYSLDKIVREQKIRLMEKGLSGDYNSHIAKLILSSNHGMAEKQEIKQETKQYIYEENADKSIEDLQAEAAAIAARLSGRTKTEGDRGGDRGEKKAKSA